MLRRSKMNPRFLSIVSFLSQFITELAGPAPKPVVVPVWPAGVRSFPGIEEKNRPDSRSYSARGFAEAKHILANSWQLLHQITQRGASWCSRSLAGPSSPDSGNPALVHPVCRSG